MRVSVYIRPMSARAALGSAVKRQIRRGGRYYADSANSEGNPAIPLAPTPEHVHARDMPRNRRGGRPR